LIIKISVASASAAFVCLAAKFIQTLGETQLAIAEVKHSVNSLTKESQRLIRSVEQASVDIQSKMNLLDPLLESAQDVGEVVHSVTDRIKQTASLQNKENTIDPVYQPSGTAWKASAEELPASADIYTPDHDAQVNIISSTPDGGLKIRIH